MLRCQDRGSCTQVCGQGRGGAPRPHAPRSRRARSRAWRRAFPAGACVARPLTTALRWPGGRGGNALLRRVRPAPVPVRRGAWVAGAAVQSHRQPAGAGAAARARVPARIRVARPLLTRLSALPDSAWPSTAGVRERGITTPLRSTSTITRAFQPPRPRRHRPRHRRLCGAPAH